jgi:transcriptional activator of cad operon
MADFRSQQSVRVGDWLVEPALDTISRGSMSEKLEPRAMRLLMCLIDSRGGVVSIEKLLSEVWAGVIVGPASVYQAISQLRKILGDIDDEPAYIATVPRKGYRLVATVQALDPAAKIESRIEPAVARAVQPDATDSATQTNFTAASPALLEPAGPRSAQINAAASAQTEPVGSTSALPVPRRLRFGRFAGAALGGLLVLGLVSVAWLLLHRQPPPDESTFSIVVLPFADLTAEKHEQPFCDGLTEELSNWLAQIPSLRVVARTSAFSFRETSTDVRKIGKALATNHVLEGTLRRSGDHIRVTVQLVDANTGFRQWSAAYDRQISDTIAIQEEISRAVADSLRIRLTPVTAQRFAARETNNPRAYQSYLLARHYQQQRTVESNSAAIALYRQILAEDPDFALAYVGLAYALFNENWLRGRPVSEIAAEAEPLLATAARLNPNSSELYAVRGALRAEQFRIDAALEDLRRAVALNPSDNLAFKELGRLFLTRRGQPRDALVSYTHAAELDPLDSLPQAQRCVALQDLGEFQEAAAACARARSLAPRNYWPLTVTSWMAAAQGKLGDALSWNAKAIEAAPDVFQLYSERATWLLIAGLADRARAVLDQARTATQDGEGVAIAMAAVAYHEGGPAALQAHLAATHLDSSPHSEVLLQVAYWELLAGDAPLARTLAERAMKTSDFSAADLDFPWNISRWGYSGELTLALIEMRSGGEASAARRLNSLSATLDALALNGETRFGVDEVRATVLALRGDGDGAMGALNRAAQSGWRRSWWAQREPDLAALRSRADFRALVTRVDQSNSQLRASLAEAAH